LRSGVGVKNKTPIRNPAGMRNGACTMEIYADLKIAFKVALGRMTATIF
jgi:hypothetical protein